MIYGDPERFVLPIDSEGRICGSDYEVKNFTNLFYFDVSNCLTPWVLLYGCNTTKVCVRICHPDVNWWVYDGFTCENYEQRTRDNHPCNVGFEWQTCDEFYAAVRDKICSKFVLPSRESEFHWPDRGLRLDLCSHTCNSHFSVNNRCIPVYATHKDWWATGHVSGGVDYSPVHAIATFMETWGSYIEVRNVC